jgi:hypothetical protein
MYNTCQLSEALLGFTTAGIHVHPIFNEDNSSHVYPYCWSVCTQALVTSLAHAEALSITKGWTTWALITLLSYWAMVWCLLKAMVLLWLLSRRSPTLMLIRYSLTHHNIKPVGSTNLYWQSILGESNIRKAWSLCFGILVSCPYPLSPVFSRM